MLVQQLGGHDELGIFDLNPSAFRGLADKKPLDFIENGGKQQKKQDKANRFSCDA